jgi:hypothetical protein
VLDTVAEVALGPHRLVLSAAEFDWLVRRTGLRLPPPFGGSIVQEGQSVVDTALAALDPSMVDESGADLVAQLAGRGVVTGAGRVHPSVLANLGVLAGPRLLVRAEATLPGGRSRAVFAVCGELGASLFARAGGAVELSMFRAVALGAELIRAVPDESVVDDPIRSSLGGSHSAAVRPAVPPAGRVPLAVLAEYEAVRGLVDDADEWASGLPGSAAELARAADLVAGTRGALHCVVFGAVGSGVGTGQVVWLCTDAGWVGLVPCSHSDGRTMLDLRPVERADIGTWLAPYIAEILADNAAGTGTAGEGGHGGS